MRRDYSLVQWYPKLPGGVSAGEGIGEMNRKAAAGYQGTSGPERVLAGSLCG